MIQKTKVDYLNFDTINSVDTNNDVFDTVFTLNQKYTNIKKIYLKSCEIPIGFPNIRSQNNTNILIININGTRYNCSVASGVYSTISTFLTALNTAITNALTSTGFSFNIAASNNKLVINTTGAVVPYSIVRNNLSDILGLSSCVNQTINT